LMVVIRLNGSMPPRKCSQLLQLMWVSMKLPMRTLKCSKNVLKFLLMMFLKLALRLHESPKVVWFGCFPFLGSQFLQHLNHHMVILLIHLMPIAHLSLWFDLPWKMSNLDLETLILCLWQDIYNLKTIKTKFEVFISVDKFFRFSNLQCFTSCDPYSSWNPFVGIYTRTKCGSNFF
jgi:hypothetical protein